MKPKVLDLFSGCGGFSLGFEKAGYEIFGFVEIWDPAITTFLKNHSQAKLLGKDITKISDKEIEFLNGNVDVIVGGPPCQGFSNCGKREVKDQRNQLYRHYLRFVRIIKPKVAVLENVKGILSMKDSDGEKIINKIIKDFISLGYSVTYKLLDAADFAITQRRERLIIIAKKIDYFPDKQVVEHLPLSSVLNNLPDLDSGLNGHVSFDTTKDILKRISKLEQGERLCKSFNFSRQRLRADKPSKTVCTQSLFIHPFEDRFLSPRELARIQSFPDSFIFFGGRNDMVKQIGNAVPPLLAFQIANKLHGEVKK